MKSKDINNEYFLKRDNSRRNNKRKNSIKNNSYISLKRSDLNDGKMGDYLEAKKALNNKSISNINNNELIVITNRNIDSESLNQNLERIKPKFYIKKLENKINNQKKQISHIIDYKNLYEKKINELMSDDIIPLTIDSLNPTFYTNDGKQNTTSKKKINTSYSQNHLKLDSNSNNKIYEKTIDMNFCRNNDDYYKQKYNSLYSKYLKLYKDYRNINNNRDTNFEISKLKNNLFKLQNNYENTLEELKKEKEKNKNILKVKSLDENNENEYENENENENVKYWKQQAEILRKNLVLSQALVNSLKSEIIQMKKNKNNNKINNGNIKRNSNYSSNNLDIKNNKNKSSINFHYSQNNNQLYDSNSPLINENNFLKQSLSNKNILLSNVLEENNRLNNVLKSKGINILDYKNFKNLNKEQSYNNINSNTTLNNIQPNKEDEITELKNNLSEYENKLYYFNDYINNIKKQIYSLHQNMSQILKQIISDDLNNKETNNDSKEKNSIFLSDNFYKGINNINDRIKDINIEFYNLDYSNDIKCFENYKEMTNIINDEIKNVLSYYKNLNFINKKENDSIIDLFELCKAVINEKPINKTLTDIFNITQGINKLYKEKYLNNKNKDISNEEIDLDKILIGQERELDYIKKSLFNVVNSKKTYSLNRNYNYNRLYNLNKFPSKVNSQTEGNEINYKENFNENFDFKNINNDNYFRNNYYSKTNNNFYKRLNNSRNNIVNRTYV